MKFIIHFRNLGFLKGVHHTGYIKHLGIYGSVLQSEVSFRKLLLLKQFLRFHNLKLHSILRKSLIITNKLPSYLKFDLYHCIIYFRMVNYLKKKSWKSMIYLSAARRQNSEMPSLAMMNFKCQILTIRVSVSTYQP